MLAVVVSLTGLAGAVKIAQTAATFGPAVGDIVQFQPQSRTPVDVTTQINATRVGGAACMLDVDILHRIGGSLVVEERLPGAPDTPRYRVHWAGQRSANGTRNCGGQADLMLDESNLDVLAMAAGGWGVGHKHIEPAGL
ncbi:MAG TPA: hypothetical protein VMB34_11055 [Acetobacteraceae bacterium]|nr:hypothetical protein [Acetobacteraceae bacterium]